MVSGFKRIPIPFSSTFNTQLEKCDPCMLPCPFLAIHFNVLHTSVRLNRYREISECIGWQASYLIQGWWWLTSVLHTASQPHMAAWWDPQLHMIAHISYCVISGYIQFCTPSKSFPVTITFSYYNEGDMKHAVWRMQSALHCCCSSDEVSSVTWIVTK